MSSGLVWILPFGMCCVVAVLSSPSRSLDASVISDTITLLANKIQSLQVKSETNEIMPPKSWKQLKGFYPSYIKVNFHGKVETSSFREKVNIYDNNMFVSTWISLAILEAYAYGAAPKPGEAQIQMMLDSSAEFYDHNRFNGSTAMSSIKTFWPQLLNSTTGTWQSNPANMLTLLKKVEAMPLHHIEGVLKALGLTELALFVQILLLSRGPLQTVLLIPPDADCTFTNLGLGALLTNLSPEFPNTQKTWVSQNGNVDVALDILVKYAYRPFSTDTNAKCIDPRSYYYAREFLEDAASRGEDIALVNTWDIDESRYMSDRSVHMAWNVNNVDVAVCSNVVYGITSAVLSGLLDVSILDRPGLMQVLLNTSSFVAWQLETDFHQRPDLAMPYYPSQFQVYWFASRTLALLEQKAKMAPLPHPVFAVILQRFRSTLREHVTGVIISKAKQEGSDMIYYDDFLGDGDETLFGKPVINGEDRIYTTAMSVNVLLNSWAVFDQGKLHWDTDVPANVMDSVRKAVTWLNTYTLSGKFKPWNAFFSVTAKGREMMPYWYPINFLQYVNGTDIPVNTTQIPVQAIVAMCGTVPESVYQTMLKQTHFGTPGTPQAFPGYNGKDVLFNFWSSDAYTYSMSLLALAQFGNLEQASSQDTPFLG